jgi:2-oxoisovalerate dehydrogenase E2 component (dihydrolipoyl transacylase)
VGVRTFNLPDPGEGLVEAEIVGWRVAVGDTVAVNDIVVEIETAKSLVELPIPWAGTVADLLVPEGVTVEVGSPIIRIEVEGTGDAPALSAATSASQAPAPSAAAPPAREPNLVGYGAIEGSSRRRARKVSGRPAPAAAVPPVPAAVPAEVPAKVRAEASAKLPADVPAAPRPLAKPPVRKYAKDRGVDLAQVSASAPSGVISRADVDAHLAGQGGSSPSSALAAGASSYRGLSEDGQREVRIPIKGVRKVTAEAMVASAFTAPHVTEFVTVDVTATKELMARLGQDREFQGARITELLFVAKALLIACRRNPGVNASWDGPAGEIVQKRYVNLGIAAATPRGLMVPNIKDADRMSLRELADAITHLVVTAREGRTQPAEMAGGTITITNVGVFGIDTGTPIINPGESAILAMGAVRRQPWVVEVPDGIGGVVERVEPRWVTQLALSFDHRLIDGDLGSRFLADIAAVLHDPTRGLIWS